MCRCIWKDHVSNNDSSSAEWNVWFYAVCLSKPNYNLKLHHSSSSPSTCLLYISQPPEAAVVNSLWEMKICWSVYLCDSQIKCQPCLDMSGSVAMYTVTLISVHALKRKRNLLLLRMLTSIVPSMSTWCFLTVLYMLIRKIMQDKVTCTE